MKNKIYSLVIILVCFISCRIPREIRNNFTLCYNQKTYNTSFNTKGYYEISSLHDSSIFFPGSILSGDSIKTNMVFFNDGIFLFGFFNHELTPSEYLEKGTEKEFGTFFKWGLYKVDKDTIMAQYVNHPAVLANTWTAYEILFKILGKNSLKYIGIRRLWHSSGYDKKEFTNKYVIRNDSNSYIASFVPIKKDLPPSDCWLKKEKWFWCNSSDWEEYMRKIK